MIASDKIELSIPSKAEYISLVRLATSGVAHEANLNVEDLEDMKVSVGEACVNVINLTDVEQIGIRFLIEEHILTIEIDDVVKDIPADVEGGAEAELGLLIIESLMDEVVFEDGKVRLIKYIL